MHKPVQVVRTRVVAQHANTSQRQRVSLLFRIPLMRWRENAGPPRERADSLACVAAKMEPTAAVRGLAPEPGNPFGFPSVICLASSVLTWQAEGLQPEVEAVQVGDEAGTSGEEAESCVDLRGLRGKGAAGAWEAYRLVHSRTHP